MRVSETKSKHMDIDEFDGTSGHGPGDDGKRKRRRRRRRRTRHGLVRRLDGTERRKGKTRKGTVQWKLPPVRTMEIHGKELRIYGDSVLQLLTVVTSGKVVLRKKETERETDSEA